MLRHKQIQLADHGGYRRGDNPMKGPGKCGEHLLSFSLRHILRCVTSQALSQPWSIIGRLQWNRRPGPKSQSALPRDDNTTWIAAN
ncbi:hypothetical protein SKAU_G00403520 [Synaphobranchus kaupii]|uniref:Uncharacterized protein n=1 Tax=Synaphobranchus kaupii TaxID=118154 RepID=A0A9Q1E9I0_SYNKA|nr:hypothetical protein SKAU_G00403520 [Synaphobranchus kaupii]